MELGHMSDNLICSFLVKGWSTFSCTGILDCSVMEFQEIHIRAEVWL